MIRPCPLCLFVGHETYNFFGLDMVDCPRRATDSHYLAHELPPDIVSGLRPLWFWEPYDPVTREMLDWNLPASIEHDRLYLEQGCSREEADRLWLEIANKVVSTIKNRESRDRWHRATEVKYQTIRKLGWIPWNFRKLRKSIGV